jgi:hypothetical protein
MSDIKLCSCCKEEQARLGEDPRALYEIPNSFVKDEPAFLCEYCDGDAFEMVLEKEEKDRS